MFSGERSALLIAAVLRDTKIFDAAIPIHAPEDAKCWIRFVALGIGPDREQSAWVAWEWGDRERECAPGARQRRGRCANLWG